MNKVRAFFKKRRYEILLVSLLLMVVGDLFIPAESAGTIRPIILIQNIVVGMILFYAQTRWRNVIAILLTLVIVSEMIHLLTHHNLSAHIGFMYVIYFITLSIKVYQSIYRSKTVEREMISAVICGFIMLCMIGSFLFFSTEIMHPGSFSNIGEGLARYQNLQYFSFITTLTIGYGDIAPLTPGARQLTILLGLAGNFYLVIVTGIVVGKFLNGQGDK